MIEEQFKQEIIASLTQEEQDQLASFEDPDEPATHHTYPEDAEAQLLGGMLHDAQLRISVLPYIKSRYFINEPHRMIAQIVMDLHNKYGDVATDWVARDLEKQIKDKDPAYKMEYRGALAELTDYYTAASCHSRKYWADFAINFYRKSELKIILHKTIQEQKDKGTCNIADLLTSLRQLETLTTGANTMTGLSLSELQTYSDEHETEWLIDKWLPRGQVVIFSAPPKAGKSTTIFSVAAGLQTGLWLNKVAVQQCPILYVDLENPSEYIVNNFRQYLPDLNNTQIRCLHPEHRPSVITDTWLESYIDESGFEETGLIVIDSATVAFGGLFPESPNWDNQAACVRRAIDPINEVARRTGWAIIIIHHDNKSGGIRGSADWAGAVDLIWRLSPNGDKRQLSVQGRLLEQPPSFILHKAGAKIQMLGTRYETEADEKAAEEKAVLDAIPVLNASEATNDTAITATQLIELNLPVGQKRLRSLLQTMHYDGKLSCKKVSNGTGRAPTIYWREKLLL